MNYVCLAEAVAGAGWQVVDLHQPLLSQGSHQCGDGIHWDPSTNRLLTCTILSHIARAAAAPLPPPPARQQTEQCSTSLIMLRIWQIVFSLAWIVFWF